MRWLTGVAHPRFVITEGERITLHWVAELIALSSHREVDLKLLRARKVLRKGSGLKSRATFRVLDLYGQRSIFVQ
jgi:hypothetical protein